MYKSSGLLFILFLIAISSFSQSYQVLSEEFNTLYKNGEYEKASELSEQVLTLAEKEFGINHLQYLVTLLNTADVYDKLESYEKALNYYDLALRSHEQIYPEESKEHAYVANTAGVVAFNSGEMESAWNYFAYAIKKAKKAELTSSENYTIYFDNLMSTIDQVPDGEEKLSFQKENCVRTLQETGMVSDDYGYATNDLALSAMNLGEFKIAEAYFEKSLIAYAMTPANYLVVLNNLVLLYETSESYDKQMTTLKFYFNTLINNDLGSLEKNFETVTKLGNHLLWMQDYDSAGFYFSFNIDRDKKDNRTLLYATVLDNYGSYLMLTGDYEEAFGSFNKAKILIEELSARESVAYGRVLNHLGEVNLLMGNYNEAQVLIPQAVDLLYQNPGPESEDYFSGVNNMGNLATALSMYDLAEDLYNKAILDADVLGDNYLVEKLYLNESKLFLKTGRFERAMLDLMDALRIDQVLFDENSLQYANYLTYQGAIQHFLGFYEESILSLEQSYQTRFDLIGKNNTLQTQTLLNLGIAQLKSKKLNQAKATLEKSIQMQEELKIEDYPDYSNTMANLGFVYFYLEDYENAILTSTLSLDFKQLNLANLETASTVFNLATYYMATGNYALAKDAFNLTNAAYTFQIDVLFPTLSEKDKIDFINTRKGKEDAFYKFAILVQETYPNISVDLYNNRLLTKGLLLSSAKRLRNGILNSGDSTSLAQYKYWNQLKKEIEESKEKQIHEADFYEKELIINELESILSKRAEEFLKKDTGSAIDWEQIRDYLQPNEVAIEMVRVGDFDFKKNAINDDNVYYVALIITNKTESFPLMVVMKNGKELETKYLKAYQNGIKYKIKDDLSYKQYWQPIAQAIDDYANVERIYLSTDGIYNKISLNTLLNPNTNNFILDEVEIAQVTNTRDILSMNSENSERNKDAYLFGFPQYELNSGSSSALQNEFEVLKSDTSSRFVRNGIVTKLPGTKHEIETIGSLLKKNSIEAISYLNTDASEKQIKELVDPYILHIATHGFFTPNVKKYPWPFDIFENTENTSNPFNGSGLLLAGAQNTINGHSLESDENGILTANEVMNLTLDNTELVVMSACETGLGEIRNGEGVYGLQRSFQVAGAKSIVMSLWTVDDTATQKMMTYFYESWLSGQNKREAFRSAQIKLREEFPEPYYWGAFIIIGE